MHTLKKTYVHLVLQRPGGALTLTNHSTVISQELCIGHAPMRMGLPNSSESGRELCVTRLQLQENVVALPVVILREFRVCV